MGGRIASMATAEGMPAAGLVFLAYPLHPPGRPEKTRLAELDGVAVPVLVIQGERDPFGMPPGAEGREVVAIPGTHTLRSAGRIAEALTSWLAPRRSGAH